MDGLISLFWSLLYKNLFPVIKKHLIAKTKYDSGRIKYIYKKSCNNDDSHKIICRQVVCKQRCSCIATVLGTRTLLKINAVLVDSPIANSCNTMASYRSTTSYNLSPSAIPFSFKKRAKIKYIIKIVNKKKNSTDDDN